jgi:tetratricopeptide (TPR) repeat protein
VTLNKTHNRMPRWLSEGISVYEERQHDPRWGEQMNAGYRQRILDGRLTPISKLSDAFLKPSSPSDLMFAYFESSLVVEYLIRDYGLKAVQAILSDLGQGIPVNEAIERHTTSLQALESDFAGDAKVRALTYGWHLDWRPVKFEPLLKGAHPDQNLMTWARRNPTHYQGRLQAAQMLIKLNQPDKARQLLDEAALLFPQAPGDDSALAQVAALRQAQGDPEGERTALLQVAAVSSTAPASLLRLLEIERDRQNWPSLQQQAVRLIEVNPLIPQPYQALAQAAEQLNDVPQALTALETLLQLAPSDPADLHYRLAVQLHKANRHEEARRAVLQALEQAPRFRAALSLLVDLQNSTSPAAEKK